MQNCPICKKEIPAEKNFPYYLCDDCVQKVTDRNGRQIEFFPDKTPRGFGAKLTGTETKYIYDICYINGEELKVKASSSRIFIEPVAIIKFGARPERPSAEAETQRIPYDPEKRKARKKQITVEKIIIPAGYVTLLAVIPGLLGVAFLKYLSNPGFIYYLSYFLIAFLCQYSSYRIIQTRVRKFHNAYFFKQHSYTFFLIGILAAIATVVLSFTHYLDF